MTYLWPATEWSAIKSNTLSDSYAIFPIPSFPNLSLAIILKSVTVLFPVFHSVILFHSTVMSFVVNSFVFAVPSSLYVKVTFPAGISLSVASKLWYLPNLSLVTFPVICGPTKSSFTKSMLGTPVTTPTFSTIDGVSVLSTSLAVTRIISPSFTLSLSRSIVNFWPSGEVLSAGILVAPTFIQALVSGSHFSAKYSALAPTLFSVTIGTVNSILGFPFFLAICSISFTSLEANCSFIMVLPVLPLMSPWADVLLYVAKISLPPSLVKSKFPVWVILILPVFLSTVPV